MRFILCILFCLFVHSVICCAAVRNPFSKEQNSTTLLINLHYAQAKQVAKLLTAKSSPWPFLHNAVTVDQRTNSLLMQISRSKIGALRKFLQQLDTPMRQVLIAARIVSVDENYTHELGLQFGTVSSAMSHGKDGLSIDVPAATMQAGQFNVAIAKLGSSNLLDLQLSALESEGHGKIISRPKLVTLNRQPAQIESGSEIPYQEKTAQGDTSVAFKKAVLRLKVTPVIVNKGKLLLTIAVNQDQVSNLTVNGVPAIQTRQINTQVMVDNNQTLVLGGVYEQSKARQQVRLPFLSSLPLLGVLFRSNSIKTKRTELLIFITPKILPKL